MVYSARQLKWWSTFELLAWLLSHSGCSSAYDNQLGSYTHQTVPKEAIKTCTYGHSKLRNSNFSFEKKLWYFDISSLDECNFFKKMQFSSSVPFQIYRNILCIYFLFSGISHFVFLSLKLTFFEEIVIIRSWNYRLSELF